MLRQAPGDDIVDGVQVGAAVVVDDALRVAGGARGVAERDGVPLVVGQPPRRRRVALGEERFVVHFAETLAGRRRVVLDVDHQRARSVEQGERALDRGRELAVGQQHLGLAVLQHEGDRFRIEPGVERVEHRARGRHAEVRFEHRRHVGQHCRDGVAAADAGGAERAGQAPAALEGLAPVAPERTVDQRGAPRIDRRGTLDEAQRRQRDEVGGVAVEADVVGSGGARHRRFSFMPRQARPSAAAACR